MKISVTFALILTHTKADLDDIIYGAAVFLVAALVILSFCTIRSAVILVDMRSVDIKVHIGTCGLNLGKF